MTVAELLFASLRAHDAAKSPVSGGPRDKKLLARAWKLRSDALMLDPKQEDPAWRSGPQHERMVAFYDGLDLPDDVPDPVPPENPERDSRRRELVATLNSIPAGPTARRAATAALLDYIDDVRVTAAFEGVSL